MKIRVLHELKSAVMLLLGLLTAQVISAVFTGPVLLIVQLIAYGGIRLDSYSPLWEWIADGVLICLLWLGIGRATSCFVWPRPAVTAVLLTIWAVLTCLMSNTVYLLPFAQKILGGMVQQVLQCFGCGFWYDIRVTFIAYFLLPAAFGVGLFFGGKRKAVGHDK